MLAPAMPWEAQGERADMAKFVFISEKNRKRYLKIILPIGDFFVRAGIHPHMLTIAGLILSLLAGFVFSMGAFFLGAWVVVLAGSCDALDGQIARQTGKSSPLGAFLDSTLDRFGDVFLLIGLAYHFAGGEPWIRLSGKAIKGESSPWTVIVIILAISGSLMVSYTRARAESIGVECKRGMMQRPERLTLLIIGSLFGALPWIGPFVLKCALLILAISTNLTALQRIWIVMKHFQGGGPQA